MRAATGRSQVEGVVLYTSHDASISRVLDSWRFLECLRLQTSVHRTGIVFRGGIWIAIQRRDTAHAGLARQDAPAYPAGFEVLIEVWENPNAGIPPSLVSRRVAFLRGLLENRAWRARYRPGRRVSEQGKDRRHGARAIPQHCIVDSQATLPASLLRSRRPSLGAVGWRSDGLPTC